MQHRRNKHIDIRHHYIRELVRSKVVDIEWLSGKELVADFLTKPLAHHKFSMCRDKLMRRLQESTQR